MSQKITVTNALTPTIVTSVKTAIAAINVILAPIIILLTDTQRKGLYKIGAIRTSEMGVIKTKLMQAHPECIPSSFTMAQYVALT